MELFRRICFFLFSAIMMPGCAPQQPGEMKNGLENFDISTDGKFFIFAWNSDKKTILFRSEVNGQDTKVLVGLNKGMSAYNPRFSADGKKIVFIGGVPENFKSSLWLTDINGNSLEQITAANSIKTEAVFSKNGKEVYFVQANEYAAYSPLASKAAHDFDIYSIALTNKRKISKMSNLNVYSLANIADIDSNHLIFDMRGEDSGIFTYKKGESIVNKISTKNDTLSYSKGYSKPIVINDSNIICTSYYVLVNIDTKRQLEKLILPHNSSAISVIRYNQKLRRLFFLREADPNHIHSVNLDGSDLKKISISISLNQGTSSEK